MKCSVYFLKLNIFYIKGLMTFLAPLNGQDHTLTVGAVTSGWLQLLYRLLTSILGILGLGILNILRKLVLLYF